MRIWIALLSMAFAALATPVWAQQSTGDTEFQVQGQLHISGLDEEDHSGGATFTYGRFLTERQELGAVLSGNFSAGDEFSGSAGPFYRYNFSTGKVVPYVGAAIAAPFGDFGTSGNVILTLDGGARFFVDRQTAFSVEARTHYFIEESELSEGLDILFGFVRLWGR